jgi:translocator assembly and maintenance protein 41
MTPEEFSNQEQDGQLVDSLYLRDLVQTVFSSSGVIHAFGYGSGVFAQDLGEKRMVDLILVVENALQFHTNIQRRHSSHYSLACRLGGANFAAWVQNNGGAQVMFHTQVEIEGQLYKYGVVEKQYLLQDLTEWNHFYLAGRLHKPTMLLIEDDEILQAQKNVNLPAAVAAGLVLIQERDPSTTLVSLSTLFESIVGLSYAGDVRLMVGAEDPLKISKLVHGNRGQSERLRKLYQPSLHQLHQQGLVHYCASQGEVQWDPSGTVRALQQYLPPTLRQASPLSTALTSIVQRSTRAQTLKGLITAGLFKSTRYALAKLSKGR